MSRPGPVGRTMPTTSVTMGVNNAAMIDGDVVKMALAVARAGVRQAVSVAQQPHNDGVRPGSDVRGGVGCPLVREERNAVAVTAKGASPADRQREEAGHDPTAASADYERPSCVPNPPRGNDCLVARGGNCGR